MKKKLLYVLPYELYDGSLAWWEIDFSLTLINKTKTQPLTENVPSFGEIRYFEFIQYRTGEVQVQGESGMGKIRSKIERAILNEFKVANFPQSLDLVLRE